MAYIDDILVVGSKSAIKLVISQLESNFITIKLASCIHYLGVSFSRFKTVTVLSQETFAKKLVELAGLKNTNLAQLRCPYQIISMRSVLTLPTKSRGHIPRSIQSGARFTFILGDENSA